MDNPIKINTLELENVKRIRAVALTPSSTGLTVIGGNNGQGKTSVLDAIAWALGGNRYCPSQPQREGALVPPHLSLTLSNGMQVERSGKNGTLKITDTHGKKGGQALLDSFIGTFALDLPKFMHASDAEKSKMLLGVLGIGQELHELDRKCKELYNKRTMVGQIADQKAKHAADLPYYSDAPQELVSISALIAEQQEILAQNGENQRLRNQADRLQAEQQDAAQAVADLQNKLAQAQERLTYLDLQLVTARTSTDTLHDQSTAALEQSIADIEQTNLKVRINLDRERALEDAAAHQQEYSTLTHALESARGQRTALLQTAALPLDALSINEEGKLIYQGQQWDNMSGSDQLRVGVAIAHAIQPACGFVLLDKLEQMDAHTLTEFGQWLQAQGLQAIATRVSTGNECSVIIEDGRAEKIAKEPQTKTWKEGVF